MADRSQYIQMRKSNQWDLNWFYGYYVEKVQGSPVPPQAFTQAFNMYFQFSAAEILERLDKEFEVQKIVNEHGQIIYIN